MSTTLLSRRQVLKMLGLTAVGAAMAACAAPTPPGAAPAEEKAAPPAPEPIELVHWSFAANRVKWQTEVYNTMYKEQFPDVTIAIESVPGDQIWDKLQATFIAGSGAPDLIDLHIRLWLRFTKEEPPLVDLTDMIGEEADNLVKGSALAPWTSRGKIYGIGNELNTALFYYRWDIFQEVGIDADALTGWDEVVAAGEQVMAQTGKKLLTVEDQAWYKFYLLLTQRGGQFFDENGEIAVNDDLGVEVLTFEQDLLLNKEVAMLQPAGAAYYGAMNQGEFVADMGAPWFQGFMKDQAPDVSGKWHMRPMPLWPGGEGLLTTQRGGTGMGITAQSEHPDAAWEFIRTCNLTVDGVMLGYTMQNLFPTYRPAWEDERLMRQDEYFDNQVPAQFIMAAADKMPIVNTSPYWGDLADALIRLALGPVLREGADVKASLDAAVEETQQLMG